MARPKRLEPMKAIHLTVPESVYDYLVNKLSGTQSLASYVLQRSGIIPEYRTWRHANPSTPVAEAPAQVLEQISCESCNLIQCDPSCPMLAEHDNTY